MKNSPLCRVLLTLTTLSALLSLALCYMFISRSRELSLMQNTLAVMQNRSQFINLLATDALEYSKKNPQIDPLLEWVGAKPGKGPAPSGAPAAPAANRPATK